MSIENPTLVHFRHFSSLLTIEDPAFLGRNEYQESSYLRAYKALHLSRTLYKSALFMQNKPNLPDVLMNVKSIHTVVYENKSNWTLGENKPNQTQFQRQKNAAEFVQRIFARENRQRGALT